MAPTAALRRSEDVCFMEAKRTCARAWPNGTFDPERTFGPAIDHFIIGAQ